MLNKSYDAHRCAEGASENSPADSPEPAQCQSIVESTSSTLEGLISAYDFSGRRHFFFSRQNNFLTAFCLDGRESVRSMAAALTGFSKSKDFVSGQWSCPVELQ